VRSDRDYSKLCAKNKGVKKKNHRRPVKDGR